MRRFTTRFVFFWVVGLIFRYPILHPSFRLTPMELLFPMPLKCPCRFGGTWPLSFPSLRSLRSLWPKSRRAGLQAHVNATDMSAGRRGICHKERRERREWEGQDRLPMSTHPPKNEKTGEAYSWESIIPFLSNRLSVLKNAS